MILLVVSVLLLAARATRVYPHALRDTGVPCHDTAECLALYNNSWCRSGQTCLKGSCHTLPDYPCSHVQECDEAQKRCVSLACKSWRDCDDDVFCNGVEKCVAGVCVVEYREECARGMCNERDKSCSMPLSLRTTAAPTHRATVPPTTSQFWAHKPGAHAQDTPSAEPSEPTAPTAAPTDSAWTASTTFIIIAGAVVALVLITMVLLAVVAR